MSELFAFDLASAVTYNGIAIYFLFYFDMEGMK